jgi:hypothetical protein
MITTHPLTTVIVAFMVVLYVIMWLVQGSPTSWLEDDDQFKGSSSFAKANIALGVLVAIPSLFWFGYSGWKASHNIFTKAKSAPQPAASPRTNPNPFADDGVDL